MTKKTNVIRNIFFTLGVLVIFIIAYSLVFDIIYNNLKNTSWWFFTILGIWFLVIALIYRSFQLYRTASIGCLLACLEVYILIYSVGQNIAYIKSVVIVGFASLFANLLFKIYVSLCTRIRELFIIATPVVIIKYKSLK